MTNPSPDISELVERLTRPIIGIHNRTPEEVFDIMVDRITGALSSSQEREKVLRDAPEMVEVIQSDRDAADELMVHIGGLLPRGNMLDVEADIAKMFAGHRLASTKALREALEPFADADRAVGENAERLGCKDGNAKVPIPREYLRRARAALASGDNQ